MFDKMLFCISPVLFLKFPCCLPRCSNQYTLNINQIVCRSWRVRSGVAMCCASTCQSALTRFKSPDFRLSIVLMRHTNVLWSKKISCLVYPFASLMHQH